MKFDKMLALLPQGIPGLHYLRALAWKDLGREEEAGAALEQELAAHPTHRRAKELLAMLVRDNLAEEKGRPAISVVIPTYNRAPYLPQAIESVDCTSTCIAGGGCSPGGWIGATCR